MFQGLITEQSGSFRKMGRPSIRHWLRFEFTILRLPQCNECPKNYTLASQMKNSPFLGASVLLISSEDFCFVSWLGNFQTTNLDISCFDSTNVLV